MPITNILISKILNKIRSLNRYDEDDIDMMRYSLQAILWEIEKIIILFIVFTIMGHLNVFLISLMVVLSIRTLAGGYHSKTAINCLIVTFVGFFLAIIVLPILKLNDFGIFSLSAFSLFVPLLAAPMRSIEKEAIQSKDKDTQKKITVLVITLIWLILVFINKTHAYAYPVLWIIVLQNTQLLLEYVTRKRKGKC